MANSSPEIFVGGKQLKLSNLDKVLYPAVGFTKAQIIDYYVKVSPYLLPHLRGRPLTLKRYPEGVDGPYFYEKQCPSHRPEWVQTAPIWSDGKERNIEFCLANDLPTLVWAANLADLELHTSLSLAKAIERPTKHLEVFDLESFAQTSGSKGLQIYVPINGQVTYDDTKPFAHAVAEQLEREHPDRVVSKMKKSLRTRKVFVDWSQNDEHKTTVCVYSLRAKQRPMVSTPVTWAEVAAAAKRGDPDSLAFDAAHALRRVEERGDFFAPVLKLKQRPARWSRPAVR